MKTKIINSTVHFKRKRFLFWEGEVRRVKEITGRIRIVYNHGTTYVVVPLGAQESLLIYQGFLIPIVENYDSFE